MINKISKTEIVDGARDYRLMTRQMVDAILEVKEYNRFSKGIFSWVGFNTKWLEYENVERRAGETKWSFWKLFKYSIDGIVAFSTFPLDIAAFIGILLCIAAFIYLIVLFVQTLAFGNPVRLPIPNVRHFIHRRHPAADHRDFGKVFGQNLPGNKKAAYLHRQRSFNWAR